MVGEEITLKFHEDMMNITPNILKPYLTFNIKERNHEN